jgi:glucoamylase
MPLLWAHAEYIKLRRSLHEGRVFDQPPQPVARYQIAKMTSPFSVWRFNHKCRRFPAGQQLRVEVLAPANVHWSADNWQTTHDTPTRDTGLGIHIADLPTASLPPGGGVCFSLFWVEANRWEGQDFRVAIDSDQRGVPRINADKSQ